MPIGPAAAAVREHQGGGVHLRMRWAAAISAAIPVSGNTHASRALLPSTSAPTVMVLASRSTAPKLRQRAISRRTGWAIRNRTTLP